MTVWTEGEYLGYTLTSSFKTKSLKAYLFERPL